MMLLASAGGHRVPVIAKLVQADEDTVRDVIHRFNEIGLACLDLRWAGGRPRLLSRDEENFVIQTATTRPSKLGPPFTRWSLRKLVAYLRIMPGRMICIGREALRGLLARRGITSRRTKTWKECPDPDREAKLDRIEEVLARFPDRVFAFDEFGPLGIRPTAGSGWAKRKHADRLPATYHRIHGVRYFHGCYSIGDGTLWGVNRRRKGAANTLAALKSIRAARPPGAPIYVIQDNLPAHKGADIRRWSKKNKVELCFTPTYASWANPIEAHFGPLRQFTVANSHHPKHTVQARACTPTSAGATPTPATATSWPPNERNAPAYEGRKASAGADAPSTPQPDQPRTYAATAHHRSTRGQVHTTEAIAKKISAAAPERRTGRIQGKTAPEEDDSGGGRLDLPREDDDLVDEAPPQMDDVRSRQAGASIRRREDPLVPGPLVRHVHRRAAHHRAGPRRVAPEVQHELLDRPDPLTAAQRSPEHHVRGQGLGEQRRHIAVVRGVERGDERVDRGPRGVFLHAPVIPVASRNALLP